MHAGADLYAALSSQRAVRDRTAAASPKGASPRYSIPKQEPLLSEHEAFRDLVLGHGTRTATGQDGLHAVLTAHAALGRLPDRPCHRSARPCRPGHAVRSDRVLGYPGLFRAAQVYVGVHRAHDFPFGGTQW